MVFCSRRRRRFEHWTVENCVTDALRTIHSLFVFAIYEFFSLNFFSLRLCLSFSFIKLICELRSINKKNDEMKSPAMGNLNASRIELPETWHEQETELGGECDSNDGDGMARQTLTFI